MLPHAAFTLVYSFSSSIDIMAQSLQSFYEIPTPKTPTKDCTRDQRLRAQTLYFDAHWTKAEIALQLNLTID